VIAISGRCGANQKVWETPGVAVASPCTTLDAPGPQQRFHATLLSGGVRSVRASYATLQEVVRPRSPAEH